ncbi:MAG: PAQR family membrane homeostasis protein TrhA [Ilumatobacteraceae bacterium]
MTPRHPQQPPDNPPAAASWGRRIGLDGQRVPLLRGRIHQASVLPVLAGSVLLATTARTGTARAAISVFGLSVVAMLTASAYYHCHADTEATKLRARRLDHAMIFVAIAGTQSAYWMLTAPPVVAAPMLLLSWLAAGIGIRHKLVHLELTSSSGSWLYGVIGWTSVVLLPFLVEAGIGVVWLVVAGGLVYSVGGSMLIGRGPDPWPGVFGYHEIWHVLVVVGVASHGAGIVLLTHSSV